MKPQTMAIVAGAALVGVIFAGSRAARANELAGQPVLAPPTGSTSSSSRSSSYDPGSSSSAPPPSSKPPAAGPPSPGSGGDPLTIRACKSHLNRIRSQLRGNLSTLPSSVPWSELSENHTWSTRDQEALGALATRWVGAGQRMPAALLAGDGRLVRLQSRSNFSYAEDWLDDVRARLGGILLSQVRSAAPAGSGGVIVPAMTTLPETRQEMERQGYTYRPDNQSWFDRIFGG